MWTAGHKAVESSDETLRVGKRLEASDVVIFEWNARGVIDSPAGSRSRSSQGKDRRLEVGLHYGTTTVTRNFMMYIFKTFTQPSQELERAQQRSMSTAM